MKVIKDQKHFFNSNASKPKNIVKNNELFDEYVNKEQRENFMWIEDCKIILEYGCGTGESLDKFFELRKQSNYQVYGVDIAKKAIEQSKNKYPKAKLYVIKNNKIPQIKNETIEAVFMYHVLHHSREHKQIFQEIYKKLIKNGKFIINDLSSRNPIIRIFRYIFLISPKFIKNRFSDDLVVNGSIPEKYRVNIEDIVRLLEETSFKIEETGYGHLFFFLFSWIERFFELSRFKLIRLIYFKLMELETFLLKYSIFQHWAEVYYIRATKI
jgi:ubiquinone/menaquinone biosynthesis C-methylase UbiE